VTGVDFAALMERAAWGGGDPDTVIAYALAASVPQLCQTCEGQGVVFCADADDIGDACDDCPTVERLLAIGAAVMTARPTGNGFVQLTDGTSDCWADHTLAALRSVTP